MKKQGKDDDDKKMSTESYSSSNVNSHASISKLFRHRPTVRQRHMLATEIVRCFFYQENVFIFIIFYSLAIVLPVGNSISWFFCFSRKSRHFSSHRSSLCFFCFGQLPFKFRNFCFRKNHFSYFFSHLGCVAIVKPTSISNS